MGKVLISILLLVTFTGLRALTLTQKEAEYISDLIWKNESNRSYELLTYWSPNEPFPSLGITHMIWLPRHCDSIFENIFPRFIEFAKNQNHPMPEDITENAQFCPWHTQEDFTADFESDRMIKLRQWLDETRALQIKFLASRFEELERQLTHHLSADQINHIYFQYDRVTCSFGGWYPILDYLNFKNTGLNPNEHYNGHRWGLVQVLLCMQSTELGRSAIEEFTICAKSALATRTQNAPPEKQYTERNWLKGWFKRLDTYVTHANKYMDK